MQSTERIEITEVGCYLDSHRGHYITRDMILLAIDFGYIVDPLTRYALDTYDDGWPADDRHGDMFQCLVDIADDARDWLNCGENDGIDRPIKGQNNPPKIPDGYAWDWFDGDFGLYAIEDLSD